MSDPNFDDWLEEVKEGATEILRHDPGITYWGDKTFKDEFFKGHSAKGVIRNIIESEVERLQNHLSEM